MKAPAMLSLIAVFCLSLHGAAMAQDDRGTLGMSVYVPLSDTVPEGLRRYRLYTAEDGITIRITATNYSDRVLRIRPRGVQAAHTFGLRSDGAFVPLAAAWRDMYRNGSSKPSPSAEVAHVDIGPKQAVGWDVLLTRPDGRGFGDGSYVVDVAVEGILGSVFSPEGEAVSLGNPDRDWDITFDVQSPRSPTELIRKHMIRGSQARAREDYDAALAAFTAADQVDTLRKPGQAGIASIYVKQGRFTEAIAIYEDMLGRTSEIGSIGDNLAVAYVGIGRTVDARATLRRLGRKDAEIEPEILRLEKAVAGIRDAR